MGVWHGQGGQLYHTQLRLPDRGAITFLFISHMAASVEILMAKVQLWYNVLQVNVQPFMAESSQLLSVHSGPCHVDWMVA